MDIGGWLGTAGHPVIQIRVGFLQNSGEFGQIGFVHAGHMGIGEIAHQQIHLPRAAMPGTENQPAMIVGQLWRSRAFRLFGHAVSYTLFRMTDQTPNQASKSFSPADRLLLLGAVIPILFIVVILAVRGINEKTVVPPAYRLVLAEMENGSIAKLDTEVVNDEIVFSYGPFDDYEKNLSVRVHIYDPATQTETVSEHKLEKPEGAKPKQKATDGTQVGESVEFREKLPAGFTLSEDNKSPDGYEYNRYGSGRNGNLFGEVFGANNNRHPVLTKDGGHTYTIRLDDDQARRPYYYNTEAVGWLVPATNAPATDTPSAETSAE